MEQLDPRIIAAVVAAIVIIVIFLLNRGQKDTESEAEKATPPEAKKPSKSALEDRLEVEAPVEIHEGMSLAEIKKAKSALITGNKGKRETAAAATLKSIEEHSEPVEWTHDDNSRETKPSTWSPEDNIRETKPSPEVVDEVKIPEPDKIPHGDGEISEHDKETRQEISDAELEEAFKKPSGLDIHSNIDTSLEDGLKKTRTGFIKRLGEFFSGPELADDLIDEIEEVLYTADIGPKAAGHIIGVLEERMGGEKDPQKVWAFVREYIESLLVKRQEPIDIESESPFVFMVIGVNGVGKTTTIGKLASKYKRQGKKVLLVAGDTFRAAAVEQLQVWGDRAKIPVHAGEPEADPASVVYSGVERAKKEGFDIVICDTAGRLHTKAPLLAELEKMGRVTKKVIENAPHETILVLDANTGQNAIQQALIFNKAVPITGIVLTKLDGTAKGGVILGICEELDAPIRFIGIGEGVHDLRTFNAVEFTEALFM